MIKPFGKILLSAALLLGSAHVAAADNRIQNVAHIERDGTTEIRIKGSEPAAFSVYKLEKPTRIVIDVSSAALVAKDGNTWMTGTWAVSQVSASPLAEGTGSVRVMVTLARMGRYTVRADGNDIVVSVTARDPMPAGNGTALAAAGEQVAKVETDAKTRVAMADAEVKRAQEEVQRIQRESANATKAAVASAADAQRAATRAQQDADAARAEADRLRTTLSQLQSRQDAKPAAVTDASIAEARASAEAAKAAAAAQASEAAAAKAAAVSAQRAAEATAKGAEANRTYADSALAAAKADAAASRNETVQTKRELEAARAREVTARATAEAARVRAEAATNEADLARADARKWQTSAEAAAARVKVVETDMASARSAAQVAEGQVAAAKKHAATADERASAAEKSAMQESQRARAAEAKATELQRALAQKNEAVKGLNARDATYQRAVADRDRMAAELKTAQAAVSAAQKAVAKPAVTKAVKVQDIRFDNTDGATVVVDMAEHMAPQLIASDARHVEYVLPGASLPESLQRKLDVTRFGTGVTAVSAYRDAQSAVRLRVDFTNSLPTFERVGDSLRFRFSPMGRVATTRALPPTVVGAFGQANGPAAQRAAASGAAPEPRYGGKRLDLEYKDAPIHDLLRILADTGRVNIVVPDEIKATVTVSMKQVPWDKALEVILESKDLWYRREGNLYRIAPRKKLDSEDEAEAARRKAAMEQEIPEPEILTLNYTDASEAKEKLAALLSPKGKIEVDDRTNSLIIHDILANRRRVGQLARQLDTQTPQINIEARIVEARSTFRREIGIQWGGKASATSPTGNATGLAFPSDITFGGNVDSANGEASPTNYAVSLPAAVGTGSGGALGLTLGSLSGNYNVSLRLSALEEQGSARIISSPSVTVLNNYKAIIRQGVSIPISTVSANGTNTTFVNADLKLEVKPYVSQQDCTIAMDVQVTKNEPDFGNLSSRGDPPLLEKEAKTRILVADGETKVMGGIYTRNTGTNYSKVPVLGDLPVLGWLFKTKSTQDDRTELLIFITPKITNKASLRCQ